MGIASDREKKLEASGVTQYLVRGEVDDAFSLVLENGINPYSVTAIQMKAMMKLRKAAYAEADQVISTALSMRADAIGYKMQGDSRYLQCKYAEAEESYRKALSVCPEGAPELAPILHDLGVSIVAQGRTEECIEWFDKAIAIHPNHADFHHHQAMMKVLGGHDKEGWEEMKWRLHSPGLVGSFPFPDKYWQGEDLKGKTIVIRSEQGWGDTIMFSRYFPWFLERASKVYFYGQRAMLPLIAKHYPDVILWPNDAPVPLDFDYHVAIMCLPRLVGLDVPAPKRKVTKGEGVGFCWFGSPTHKADHLRSVPVEMFARFADAIDSKLYSLGYGFFWKMEDNIVVGHQKPDFVEYCITDKRDWAETAEVVKDLDLVITVDTAIAHLAGFLGVDCWLLLPFVPDFRWGMKGETTHWYPSMKLYRQQKLMDWNTVFERVENDLRSRVQESKKAA